jgi:hypothetical protein
MKKDLEDIKLATLDTQNREADRWSKVDALMIFLQDLRQAMVDSGKGKAQEKQVFAGPQPGPSF